MPDASQISPITPRSAAIPESAAVPFEAKRLACEILRSYRSAALSTLDPQSGYPYGSVTDIATDHDGTPFFLLAGLALHTRNIAADNRVSLVLASLGQGDALAKARLTLVGRSQQADEKDMARLTFRFLQRHPKAKLYLSLPDVRLHLMHTEAIQLSAGPGRNAAEVRPPDLITDLMGADDLLTREAYILEKLNRNAEVMSRLASAAGLKTGRWRVTGLDPEGLDIAVADKAARLWFNRRVTGEGELFREVETIGHG